MPPVHTSIHATKVETPERILIFGVNKLQEVIEALKCSRPASHRVNLRPAAVCTTYGLVITALHRNCHGQNGKTTYLTV